MRFRRAQTEHVDQRISLLTEITDQIRAVKLHAYEDYFSARVSAIRKEEHGQLRQYGLMRSSVNGFFFVAPICATICECRISLLQEC